MLALNSGSIPMDRVRKCSELPYFIISNWIVMALLLDLCLANTGLTPDRKEGCNPISPYACINQFHFSSGHQVLLSVCVYLPLHYSAEQEQRALLVSLGHKNQAKSAAAVCKGRHSKFISLWIFNVAKALALHWPMQAPSKAGTDFVWVTSLYFNQ